MKNIAEVEISQKDLHGITLIDFHNHLLEIGPVRIGDRLTLTKACQRNPRHHAPGEPYGLYGFSNSNGTERENRTQAERDAFIKKHVQSFSYIRFS